MSLRHFSCRELTYIWGLQDKIEAERRCSVEKVDLTVQTPRDISIPPPDLLVNDLCVRLSDRDADQVLASVENPPAPNTVALTAARRFLQKHG
jgi:hypothetical protein